MRDLHANRDGSITRLPSRSAGALRDAPDLWMPQPSTPVEVTWERSQLSGPLHGVEAARVNEREPGEYLFEVRRTERDQLRDIDAELLVIVGFGTPGEKILRVPVRLTRTDRTLGWRLTAEGTGLRGEL